MKPVNQTERRKAFFNFLIFFVITVGVILVAIFFSVQVPFRENDKLRKDMNIVENDKLFMRAFEMRMHETMNLLDSVNLSQNFFLIENEINRQLKDMNAAIPDSSQSRSLCINILNNLRNLQAAKEQIRETNNNFAESEKKDQTIQDLKREIERYQLMIQQHNLSAK